MSRNRDEVVKELREIDEEISENKEKERRQKNFEMFKNRFSDWVIGKAHAETKPEDNGWHHPRGQRMPQSVSIHGNVGHTYYLLAQLTSASNTFFHNVWGHDDRASFEKALEELVHSEVTRIMSKLKNVLEILGLQSTSYFLKENYPKDKIKEIEEDIWKETIVILDEFKDDAFEAIVQTGSYEDDGETKKYARTDLYHSNHIFDRYIKEKRPHLIHLTQRT